MFKSRAIKVTSILTEAGLHDSVWGKRIIVAATPNATNTCFEGFTYEDDTESGEWVTCACGRATPSIPRDRDDRPLDSRLVSLGNLFHDMVLEDNMGSAARLLVGIEERALEVSKEHRLRGKS